MTTPPNQAPSTGGESEKMKPCPFCGSRNILICRGDGLRWALCICGAKGPARLEDDDEALDWNSRAPDPLIEQLQRERDEARQKLNNSEEVPGEPGGFVGDIFFGDPRNSTRGTHRWTGADWERLPDEVEVLMNLLASARSRALAAEASAQQMREALEEIVGQSHTARPALHWQDDHDDAAGRFGSARAVTPFGTYIVVDQRGIYGHENPAYVAHYSPAWWRDDYSIRPMARDDAKATCEAHFAERLMALAEAALASPLAQASSVKEDRDV